MTIYALGMYRDMMQARRPVNVVPLRKVQPTPQQLRQWQRENKACA